jgi:carbamoyl-phosphate synthase large subunit
MNILFTCAGRRNYLINYFKEALAGTGKVFAADMDLTAPALVDADVAIQVSNIYSATYIDEILELSKKHKINAIISLNDLELPILAEHKWKFTAQDVQVIVSDTNVIDIAFDKYKTHQFLLDIGLNSPKTYISLSEAKQAITNGELTFPLIVKPRWGSASIGLDFPESLEELDLAYQLQTIKLKKSILNIASESDSEHAILIQEALPGDEYGLDIVNDFQGNHFGTFTKKKLKMRSGETDKAVSIIDERFNEIGEKIGKNLKHIGNADCDVFLVNNKLYVLEINPRFGGGYPFSHEAGVDLVSIYLEWLKGNTNIAKYNNYKADVLCSKCDRILNIKQ